jgi:hypothetical protein
MIPLASIRHYKKIVTFALAISILAAIGCDTVCKSTRLSTTPLNSVLVEPHHHRKELKGHHHADQESHDHSHHSNSQDTDNCCKDITNQFYQSLFKNNEVTIIKAPAFTVDFFVAPAYYHDLYLVDSLTSVQAPPKIPPEITGSYLRILMSSFLI